METTNFGNLKRDDIFTFNGQSTKWRVALVQTEMKDRDQYPVKIVCVSLKNKQKRTFDLSSQYNYNGSFCTLFDRTVNLIVFDPTGNNHPVKIEDGEWYFKGCFITEQRHPKLLPYHVHQDTEENLTVGVAKNWHQAHKMCVENEVLNPKHGALHFQY